MTTEERFERLENAVIKVAESQASTWDAIGQLTQSMARADAQLTQSMARTDAQMSALAGRVESTENRVDNLKESLDRLEALVERYIRAQTNGRDGGEA